MINNELDHFVIYKPQLRHQPGIFVSIGKSQVRFSADVVKAFGTDHLLLFFDEGKQRILIQPAKKGTTNAVKLSTSGRGSLSNTLVQKNVVNDIRNLGEFADDEKGLIYGHKCMRAQVPSIIFNLKEREKEQ